MAEKRKYWTGAQRAPAQDRFFLEALDPGLWAQGGKQDWNACWHTGMPAPDVFKRAGPGAWINHIPGNAALTVKSALFETLSDARERATDAACAERLAFFPHAYLMPEDYHALQRDAFENPAKRWIVKPKRLSRGRGVAVCEDAGAAPFESKWLVQEYLADPHLYDGRKYVLRCYLLIRSLEPLQVYLYRDGFAKLASEPYRDGEFDNLYAHLTNPDVNILNPDADASVVFISFDEYRAWLGRGGHDAAALFAKIRDIAALTAIAARERMRAKLIGSGAAQNACYELIGLDCMVDAALKPWLLECNLSPSLDICAAPENGGDHETETKRALVRDLVALLGLNEAPAEAPPLDDDRALIAAAEAERARAGGFAPVFPDSDAGDYLPYFPAPRAPDLALARHFAGARPPALRFAPMAAHEEIFEDGLALYDARKGAFLAPDEASSFIWLKAGAGAAPDAIAEELAALTQAGEIAPALRRKVWGIFADWGAAGLVGPPSPTRRRAEAPRDEALRQAKTEWIFWAGERVRIDIGAPEIAPRIEPVIAPLRAGPDDAAASVLRLLRGAPGYAIASATAVRHARVRLSRLGDALRGVLLAEDARARPGDIILNTCVCSVPGGGAALFASDSRGGWDGVAAAFAMTTGGAILGAAARLGDGGRAAAVPVPGRVLKDDLAASGLQGRDGRTPALHEWSETARGVFAPATADAAGERQTVRALFVLMREVNGDEAAIKALGPREGLIALDRLRPKAGRPMSADKAGRFARWRRDIAIYEIRHGGVVAAARAALSVLDG